MGVWDMYTNRIENMGGTKRGASLVREARYLTHKLPDNLSYHMAPIFDAEHGYNITDEQLLTSVKQNVAIINSDNLNEKYIYSMPGEDVKCGSLVRWMDNYWIVSERDANTTLYTRAKLIQCNHLLKWVTGDGRIIEQWSVVEDGTKYLTGELEDRHFIVSRGDSRISVMIARNKESVKLGRRNRFLIDDDDSPLKLAYTLSKPLKLGWAYNNEGVFKFVLQEVDTTDDDNQELGVADYYKYYPREEDLPPAPDDGGQGQQEQTGKKVWL